MVTEIIAAGAMGVSVFFAIKAYSLLKDEQAKDSPRPTMLRSIYVFMGFALLMTPMALGIEYARHSMDMDSNGNDQAAVADKLKALENKTYYALNRDGNPEAIELDFGGTTYQLGTPFPESGFKDTRLKLKPSDQQQFLALKDNNGKEITYGYIDGTDIKNAHAAISGPNVPPPPPTPAVDPTVAAVKLMAAGLMYTPASPVKNSVQQFVTAREADESTANRFLVDFINAQTEKVKLQEQAVKILIQPTQMVALEDAQYDKLIKALSENGPRKAPWRFYELAQVYLTRSSQKGSQADRNQYFSAMCAYKRSYDGLLYLKNDPEKYAIEYGWYQEAERELRAAKCDTDCNCTEK